MVNASKNNFIATLIGQICLFLRGLNDDNISEPFLLDRDIEGLSFILIQFCQVDLSAFTHNRCGRNADFSFTGTNVRKRLPGFPTHQLAQARDFVARRSSQEHRQGERNDAEQK